MTFSLEYSLVETIILTFTTSDLTTFYAGMQHHLRLITEPNPLKIGPNCPIPSPTTPFYRPSLQYRTTTSLLEHGGSTNLILTVWSFVLPLPSVMVFLSLTPTIWSLAPPLTPPPPPPPLSSSSLSSPIVLPRLSWPASALLACRLPLNSQRVGLVRESDDRSADQASLRPIHSATYGFSGRVTNGRDGMEPHNAHIYTVYTQRYKRREREREEREQKTEKWRYV